ncbi:hypothetical protein BVX95_01045 [archaeon D22]|nr:hypothetical protein BVX95_01045 [archaeon D22]
MSTQISLKLSDKMFNEAKKYADQYGYDNLQDLIRETLREKIFGSDETLSSINTMIASEQSLAKAWLSKEEDEAWEHLQKD